MAKSGSGRGTRTVNKSAVTGRFVKASTVKSNPRATYRQTVSTPKKKSKRGCGSGGGTVMSIVTGRIFSESELRAVAQALGDTEQGLTNAEIDELLQLCGVADEHGPGTKW